MLAAPALIAAFAAGPVSASATMPHESTHQWEVQTLGAEHAAEHAAIRHQERRASRRWAAFSPAQRHRASERYAASYRAALRASKDFPKPASKVGAWTQAPYALPNYAIHSALLPTGKVLFWGYPDRAQNGAITNEGRAAVWNPRRGTSPGAFHKVPPPKIDVNGDGHPVPAPIWCAGESHLPNGDILVTGGNLVNPTGSNRGQIYTDYAGIPNVFTFDPWTETWTQQQSLEAGRWYPTQIELADGTTDILGGYTDQAPGAIFNQTLDMFQAPDDPLGQGVVTSGGLQPYGQTLFPRLELLPNGDVIMAGPTPLDTAIFDPKTQGWSDYPDFGDARNGTNIILEPGTYQGSWRISLIGGYGWNQGDHGAFRTTETTLASDPNPSWREGPALNVPRAWENTILLPDGSKVAVGGGTGYNHVAGNFATSPSARQRQVEVYDPVRHVWRLGPPEVEDRTYHSTALLLPDGRVWSAGDDDHPLQADGNPSTSDTAEIYSPPYLFRGARPAISKWPATLGYQQTATVRTGHSGPDPESAVLISPAAATHSVDTSQRYVKLKVLGADANRLHVESPPDPEVAPPGYYMLFVLDADGVPSKARWVQLK